MSLRDPDAFYQALVGLHAGLDAEQSQELNGRLILLMAHHIGDDAIVMRLLKEAAASK
jgi:hypothetical protein